MAEKQIKDFTEKINPSYNDKFILQETGGTYKYCSGYSLLKLTNYYYTYKDLLVSRPTTSTILISWGILQIENIYSLSRSFTLNITNSGALGLDTGTESVSAWYYIWAIAKTDGTVSAIFSLNTDSPVMPSGYTVKRLVSVVRNNSSGNFVDFVQQNQTWRYKTPVSALAGTASQSSITNTDCSTCVPPLSIITVRIYAGITINNSTSGNVLHTKIYGGVNSTAVLSLYTSQQATASQYEASDISGDITSLNGILTTWLYCTAAATSTWIYIDVYGLEIPL